VRGVGIKHWFNFFFCFHLSLRREKEGRITTWEKKNETRKEVKQMTVSFRVVYRVRETEGPFEAGACRNTGLREMDERGRGEG
jgi:hypothetical protein